jgi:hypothetical protein
VEAQEFGVPVAGFALGDHFSCGHIQGSKEERLGYLPTVMPVRPIRVAMVVLVSPAPQAKTIWARCTIECSRGRELARASSCWTSSSLRTRGGIGRPSAT